jgi:hypothetical protein
MNIQNVTLGKNDRICTICGKRASAINMTGCNPLVWFHQLINIAITSDLHVCQQCYYAYHLDTIKKEAQNVRSR